jgi:putative ribosome biogenesis GTPase RsgA
MLSPSLLRELCQKSIEEYERFIGFSGVQIEREEEEGLRAAHLDGLELHFVVGDSGLGKSTLLWRVARDRITKGSYALWLPAHYVAERLSLQAGVVA